MIQRVKVAAIAALFVLGTPYLKADQTNLVQNLSIRLTGIAPGKTDTNRNVATTSLAFVRVNTSDVIKELGTATANNFSRNARLVVITALPDGNSAIAVRDGNNSVDVTSFFVYEQKSGFVSTSVVNVRTGRGTSTDYSIQRLALADSANYPALGLHFDVQGIGVQSSSTAANGVTKTELDAGVTGSGDQKGKLLILEGTFGVDGSLLEVVPVSNPPNA